MGGFRHRSCKGDVMARSTARKWVYYFGIGGAEGKSDMKDLLGGKGAGLAEMTHLKIPVPPGFTITTEACVEFYNNGRTLPANLKKEVLEHLKKIEAVM